MDADRPPPPLGPGYLGYGLVWSLSVGIYALGLTLTAVALDPGGWREAMPLFTVVLMFTAVLSVPFALVGLTLVHVLTAHRSQAEQVGAAAVAGLVPWPVLALLVPGVDLTGPGGLAAMLGLAFSTGSARALVVPVVHARRRAAAVAAAGGAPVPSVLR